VAGRTQKATKTSSSTTAALPASLYVGRLLVIEAAIARTAHKTLPDKHLLNPFIFFPKINQC